MRFEEIKLEQLDLRVLSVEIGNELARNHSESGWNRAEENLEAVERMEFQYFLLNAALLEEFNMNGPDRQYKFCFAPQKEGRLIQAWLSVLQGLFGWIYELKYENTVCGFYCLQPRMSLRSLFLNCLREGRIDPLLQTFYHKAQSSELRGNTFFRVCEPLQRSAPLHPLFWDGMEQATFWGMYTGMILPGFEHEELLREAWFCDLAAHCEDLILLSYKDGKGPDAPYRTQCMYFKTK